MDNLDSENLKMRRIVFLDWLRIFAFGSVLVGHKFFTHLVNFSNDESIHATPRLIAKTLLPFFLGGGAGVVVFFFDFWIYNQSGDTKGSSGRFLN